MTSKAPSIQELDAFEAMLEGMDGVQPALDKLGGRTDPESVAARLVLLIRAQRFDEAAHAALALPLHRRWIDKAVLALAAIGDITKASKMLASDPALQQEDFITFCRCIVAVCEGALAFCDHNKRDDKLDLTPISLSEEGLRVATDTLSLTVPLVDHFRYSPPTSPLESEIVEHALTIAFLASAEQVTQSCVDVLVKITPCSKSLAHAIVRHQVQPIAGFPQRLRTDYPTDFEAQCLAALIQGLFLHEPEKAVLSAMALAKSSDPDQKVDLGRILYQLMKSVSGEIAAQVRSVLVTLWPPDSRFAKLLAVEDCFDRNDFDAATVKLAELKDESDPYWLQLNAQCSLLSGDYANALDNLLKAIELVPHPALLKQVAVVAAKQEDWDTALIAVDKLLHVYPTSSEVLLNRASILINQGNHAQAAECFKTLGSQQPEELRHKINEALSRARAGDLHGSLAVYEQIKTTGETLLEVLLSKAQVLEGLGRTAEAFDYLTSQKEHWWDNAQFVAHYMSLGYRTQNEDAAHAAFERLRELDSAIDPDQRFLKLVSMDDLKAHATEYKERRDFLLKELISGRLPWLMVDSLLRNVPYLAWGFRTQPLRWVYESPLEWAQYNLYSTHSFAVLPVKGQSQLVALKAPPKGNPVVIDLSSLITLHRLGLLPKAAEYFGEIYFPATFLSQVLEDATRLSPHQLSQYTAPDFIRRSVEARRLTVCSPSNELPVIDEHSVESGASHCYRLIDLVNLLHSRGLIGDEQYKRLQGVCHEVSAVDAKHPPLQLQQQVRFGLSTLQMLNTLGVGEEALDAVAPNISSEDYDEALKTVHAFGFLDKIAKWHSELWDYVRADGRFLAKATPSSKKVSVPKPDHIEAVDHIKERDDVMWPVASAELAIAWRVPLLADDRASQVMFWSAIGDVVPNAFGTNHLIDALQASGGLPLLKAADSYLQLMRWRYRFLVLPPMILKSFTDQFRNCLPGRHLREVAVYIQDSMSDPGLLAGMEKTAVPTSMANGLFHAWCQAIASFLAMVWQDRSYSDDQAEQITCWAAKHLLPAVSARHRSPAQRILAEMTPRAFLSNTLIQVVSVEPPERASLAMRTIAKSLELSEEDYMTCVSEVIDVEY